MTLGWALLGSLRELDLGKTKVRCAPQLPWVVAFVAWGTVTVLIRSSRTATPHILQLAIALALYLVIAHGVQTFQSLHVVAGTILAMVLLVCGVCTHPGISPNESVRLDESTPGVTTAARPDGR